MRQLQIHYKRGDAQFGVLDPVANRRLYDVPEVNDAITQMRDNPHIVGMAIRLGDELFNLLAFDQQAEAPKAMPLEGQPCE